MHDGGPRPAVHEATTVCVTGAPAVVTVDGSAASPPWQPVAVPAGGVLDVGAASAVPACGSTSLVRGGLTVPRLPRQRRRPSPSAGSAATRAGPCARATCSVAGGGRRTRSPPQPVPMEHRPVIGGHWEIAVTEGPHGAPEFFTREDIDTLLRHRLRGALQLRPHRCPADRAASRDWARTDGGEAGLHPSNIHDNAYSVGALDFTGDTPILLGPDGPSLGGFVCPVTVVAADRWKLGQLTPGRHRAVRARSARPRAASRRELGLGAAGQPARRSSRRGGDGDDGVIARRDGATAVTYRRSRRRQRARRVRRHDASTWRCGRGCTPCTSGSRPRSRPGLLDLTPGIRSLQVQRRPRRAAGRRN